MSLELKIENLTLAINALNVNIAKLVNVPMCDNPELAAEILERELPKAKRAKDKVVTSDDEIFENEIPANLRIVLTHKDVQDFMLSFVREDMKRKPKIKKLLAEYSASKVSDLDVDVLEAFKAELVKL